MANVVDVLSAVDDCPASESGALVIDDGGGDARGTVLVETRRVCWAAAPGRGARLRDLLRRHAERALDDAELDAAFARAREEQRPISELLTERSLVSDDGLRAALKQHTVESLIAQCDGSHRPTTWVPHRQRGYRARFTFPPSELLAAVGAELYPAESEGADHGLDVAATARTAGSFAIGDDDAPVAVRIAGASLVPVRELLELGDWAAAALTACNGFSAAVLARAASAVTGPTALGWRSARRLVHAAVFDDPAAINDAISELARRGAPVVLSPRVPSRPNVFPRSTVSPDSLTR
jgi:hypothetical protein